MPCASAAPDAASKQGGLGIPGYFAYEDDEPAVPPLDDPHPQAVITEPAPLLAGNIKLEDLSRRLLAAYPEQELVDVLLKGGPAFMIAFQANFVSYRQLDDLLGLPELERPGIRLLMDQHTSKTHPVIIAEQMLMLANVLQHMLPDLQGQFENPQATMARLADTAIDLVVSNDRMMGTAEALVCLMLESIYHANLGNLRLSWLARRRAASLAQIMGMHRRPSRALRSLKPGCAADSTFVWYRIQAADRFLSLMLGLPPASMDNSMIAEPAFSQDTPMGQLERRHCVAAGRILERNDRDPSADNFAFTQTIDLELQQAATAMPSKWWLVPDTTAATSDKELFWESHRLMHQTYHFYLFHQLHLPYMLLGSALPASQHQYDYNRSTCISASRDILSRCLLMQKNQRLTCNYRVVGLWALMASLTILLTHLSCKRLGPTGSILAHQRMSDRAMVEQVLENMKAAASGDDTGQSGKCSRMLRQLLAIDTDPTTASENNLTGDSSANSNHAKPLSVFVPYFGLVVVSRDGEITAKTLNPERAAHDLAQLSGDGELDARESLPPQGEHHSHNF
ncbi:hypothetical protein ACHAPT_012993 [Fusarium lateritium]